MAGAIARGVIRALDIVFAPLLAFAVSLLTLLINFILYIIAWVARFVMETMFAITMNMPYIDLDGGNPAFEVGWTILRDIANMGLVIVLIAIAVGTMLSLKTVNKSLLGKFIIVALLINFTPIFVGVVLDMSHITASVFWGPARDALDSYMTESIWRPTVEAVKMAFEATGLTPEECENPDSEECEEAEFEIFGAEFDILSVIGLAITSVVTILLNIVLIFVFLFLAALAGLRTVILIILVILSPIAFVAYILPATKRAMAEKWFSNFIQWSIIIVPLTFFLWLAGVFVTDGVDQCMDGDSIYMREIVNLENSDIEGDTTILEQVAGQVLQNNFMCSAIVVTLALGTLILGVVLSFSFTAAGANIVIDRAKKTQQWAVNKARQKTRQAGQAGRQAGRQATQKPRRALRDKAFEQQGRGGAVRRRTVGAAAGMAGKRMDRTEKQRKDYWKQHTKEFEGLTEDGLAAQARNLRGTTKGVAAMDMWMKRNPGAINRVLEKDPAKLSAEELQEQKEIKDAVQQYIQKSAGVDGTNRDNWLKMNPQDDTSLSKEELENRVAGMQGSELAQLSARAWWDEGARRGALDNPNFGGNTFRRVVANKRVDNMLLSGDIQERLDRTYQTGGDPVRRWEALRNGTQNEQQVAKEIERNPALAPWFLGGPPPPKGGGQGGSGQQGGGQGGSGQPQPGQPAPGGGQYAPGGPGGNQRVQGGRHHGGVVLNPPNQQGGST